MVNDQNNKNSKNVAFSLSDDKLKILLETYWKWLPRSNEEQYVYKQRERAEYLKTTLLNKDYLETAPDEELFEKIINYSRTLERPTFIRLGETRLKSELKRIKDNLLYFITSDEDPFVKAANILTGERKIRYFHTSFWTPIFQAMYPNLLPIWNNKTETFFEELGLKVRSSKLSIDEKYRLISDAYKYLQHIFPQMDFHHINHLMHYGTAIEEGVSLIRELKGEKKSHPPPPDTDEFPGFSSDVFNLLKTLAKDTSYETVKKISDEIYQKVKTPLRLLFKEISSKFDKNDVLNLEKEKRIIANLFKPNPRLGAFPYIWGAFYQKGESRLSSMQFFVWLDKDVLTYGVYPSIHTKRVRERLANNLQNFENELQEFLPPDFFQEFLFFSDYFERRDFYEVKDLKQLSHYLKDKCLNIGKLLTAEEVVNLGKELSTKILSDFEQLVPIYVCGISDNPIELLEEYFPEKGEEEISEEYKKEYILREIFIDEEKFDQIVSLLEEGRKKQIILQGPPGTGKTYLARRIAGYLTKSEERIEVIQFHASYSYEDFVEGFRPGEGEGFRLIDGIFKTFCRKARANPERKFVLVIDEINRGNLSKIFGELLYLLEYRKERVRLAYSRELFYIPENVYIIGTMNTADRSLAIMDYALRRRFFFIDLECQTEPLRSWLVEHGCQLDIDSLVNAIEVMNLKIYEEMQSHDFAIGHSYFMKENLDKEKLEQIVQFELKPLLEEYFFDKQEKADEIIDVLIANVK